jgi:hypothetical protein
VGFWLGGLALGVPGCVLGAVLPYQRPLAVALSVLWWGTFLGCFGASVGALLVLLWRRPPAAAAGDGSQRPEQSPADFDTWRPTPSPAEAPASPSLPQGPLPPA